MEDDPALVDEKLSHRTPLEQGQTGRCQTAPPTQPRLVDPHQAADRWPQA